MKTVRRQCYLAGFIFVLGYLLGGPTGHIARHRFTGQSKQYHNVNHDRNDVDDDGEDKDDDVEDHKDDYEMM